MKRLVISSISISFCILSACGTHESTSVNRSLDYSSTDENKSDSNENSGIQLTIRNELPDLQSGQNPFQQHLIGYVCYPQPKDLDGPAPTFEDRCFKIPQIIENRTTRTFYIPLDAALHIYMHGKGKAVIEFIDSRQSNLIPYPCNKPSEEIPFELSKDHIHYWSVLVNGREPLTFHCQISMR